MELLSGELVQPVPPGSDALMRALRGVVDGRWSRCPFAGGSLAERGREISFLETIRTLQKGSSPVGGL
jgi:hypothetical protein